MSKQKDGKFIVQRGRYIYKGKLYKDGDVYYQGNMVGAYLFFRLMPVGKGRIYLKKGDKILRVKTIHRVSKP